MLVRTAFPSDVDAIFDIRTSVVENYLSRKQLADLGITPKTIAEMIALSPCCWVAELDGKCSGFAMADVTDGSVFALFVRPEVEGQGVGSSLMEKVEEYLFEHHSLIWLTTEKNSRAQAFYQKRGWTLVENYKESEVKLEKPNPAHA